MIAGMRVRDLLEAYAQGLFPMDGGRGRGIGLYVADPRAIIPVDDFRLPRSVARAERRQGFTMAVDRSFRAVCEGCAAGRDAGGRWLSPRLIDAYVALNAAGFAHSVEIWRDDTLCGGLFGVALGGLFTSESMFHTAPDAGNLAVLAAWRHIAARGYVLWDIQMATPHTRRFGAVEVSHERYRDLLDGALRVRCRFTP